MPASARRRPPMDIAQARTLIDLFHARAAASGSRTAMMLKRDGAWQSIGWGEVASRVRAIAAGLATLGVNPGDRVAILAENRPEWAFADLGALCAGAVDVPIYATNLAKQCEFIFKNSGAVVTFTSTPAQLEKVFDCFTGCPDLRIAISFEPVPE